MEMTIHAELKYEIAEYIQDYLTVETALEMLENDQYEITIELNLMLDDHTEECISIQYDIPKQELIEHIRVTHLQLTEMHGAQRNAIQELRKELQDLKPVDRLRPVG